MNNTVARIGDVALDSAASDVVKRSERRTNRYPKGRFFMKNNEKGGLRQHPLEIGGIHSVRKPRKDYDWLGIYAAKRGWTE